MPCELVMAHLKLTGHPAKVGCSSDRISRLHDQAQQRRRACCVSAPLERSPCVQRIQPGALSFALMLQVMHHPELGHGGILLDPAWQAQFVANLRAMLAAQR